MFDNYIYIDGSLKNIIRNGKKVGFEMKTGMPYYRGVPLSLVRDLSVEVDGKIYDKEKLLFSVDNEEFFSLKKMETVYNIKWEYGVPATVRVMEEGGLEKGEHRVKLYVSIIIHYVPFPSAGTRTVIDFVDE
ncbi:MAG: C-glycoside deglycosidase beta subunit domain-containing protein [Christensenellales bacterium]|jgi:hypothetical protein